LENFEFSLVKEALHDQKYLLDTYPDLVKLRPFYLPIYKNSKRPTWMIHVGLWLYGFFAQHEYKPKEVKKEDFLTKFSAIKAESLKAVFLYYDGKTDDDTLTHKIAQEARELGVTILEHTFIDTLPLTDEQLTLHINNSFVHTNTHQRNRCMGR